MNIIHQVKQHKNKKYSSDYWNLSLYKKSCCWFYEVEIWNRDISKANFNLSVVQNFLERSTLSYSIFLISNLSKFFFPINISATLYGVHYPCVYDLYYKLKFN